MNWSAVASAVLVLALAPALPGVATRTRSYLTGRRGPPVLQLYFELAKLLRKTPVYSATTTRLFRAAPWATLAAVLLATFLVPLDGRASLSGFAGDFLLFAGLFAVGRFLTILAAFDTGSSLEGMGASRDAMVGTYAEPGLLLGFAAMALVTGRTALSGMLGAPLAAAWSAHGPALAMLGTSLFVLLLAESFRVPVDDPATHLELTMIHEVAILDYSGPDLAAVLYASALKFALLAFTVAAVLVPRGLLAAPFGIMALPAVLGAVGVIVGIVEAAMARLRLNRVPQLLVATSVLAMFATILLLARP